MSIKLITNDCFFNEHNLRNLADDKEYAILVVDQVIFFKKEENFFEKFSYTIELYKKSSNRYILDSLYSKSYRNTEKEVLLANSILNKLEFKYGNVGVIDLESQTIQYYSLIKKREDGTKSDLKLCNLLCKESDNTNDRFRIKGVKELAINAKIFLTNNIVYHKFYDLDSKYFPGVGIEYSVTDKYIECGYGRGYSFEEATNIAMLEALERYASLYYTYENKEIYGTYLELPQAIHPSKFILPSSSKNNYILYTDNLSIYWTEAESLKNSENVLIPEQLSVFGDSFFRDEEKQNRFIYDSSNGVALGASFEEACFYGLLELIERDNFLTTWYGSIPVKEVDINSLGLKNTTLKIINTAQDEGWNIKVYDISMEMGVPSFWSLITTSKETSNMFSYTAAGSNPDPSKAAETALLEALVGITIHENKNTEVGTEAPSQVLKMEDHVDYYSTSNHKEAFDFLKSSSITNLTENNYINRTALKPYLKELITKVLKEYEDIYIVNLTSKDMENLGIFVVKVVVPGMLPITFGMQNERVSLDRINKERGRRGLEKIEEVNVYPHPFP